MKKRTAWIGLWVVLLAGAALLAYRTNGGRPATWEAQRGLMGTIVKIKAQGSGLSRERFDALSGRAFDEIARLEKEMSEWLPDSPISQAARLAGQRAVPVSRL